MAKTAMWSAGSDRARPVPCRGFTLLELLLVLVIASLSLTLVGPRLVALIPGVELQTEAARVAALLRYTRGRAISGGIPVAFYLSDPAERRILLSDQSREYQWPPSVALTLVPLRKGSSDQPGIYFYPDGRSNGGRVSVVNNSGEYRIEVNRISGEVVVDEP